MPEKLDKHILPNGLVILAEPMQAVGSVAFDFLLPAGASLLPTGCCGAGNIITDWIFRGAGEKDSRQLVDALDGLGLHRGAGVSSSHITIGAALEAGNLAAAIALYADVILKPRLQPEQFELAKQLAIQSVLGLDDDPRQKVMLKLKENFYPGPLGRSTIGQLDELDNLTADVASDLISSHFDLSQTILAVAGKYNFDVICKQAEELFDVAAKNQSTEIEPVGPNGKYTHIPHDGAQVHIGLMTETIRPGDEDYYNARVAISVLSGGMSSRLFTEVREKRGLCYAIGASYHGLKQAAGIGCYAGTTPDKAQETYDVVTDEFKKLSKGITEEEIQRAKVGLKSALILQSESSSSRASGIASDYYILGKVRTLDEIKNKIEETTCESILEFLNKNLFKDFTVVTIGPKEIVVN